MRLPSEPQSRNGEGRTNTSGTRHRASALCYGSRPLRGEDICPSSAAERPASVLFLCGHNAVRSPIAAALADYLFGRSLRVASAGVRKDEPDPFVTAVMDEIGIDLSRHRAKTFDDLEDTSFDLIISLSPEAQHRAMEMTRTMACDVEFWNTLDPSIIEGGREERLDAYRDVRDGLMQRIRQRFPAMAAPQI